jgi:hypothetical protein
VDPLAEKYLDQTPYSYVGNRPLIFIDPDGMEEWEINADGQVAWKKESEDHTLYKIDNEGNRTGESLTLENRDTFDQLASGTKNLSKALGDEDSQDDMVKTFKFCADTTRVEWRVDRYQENGEDKYALGTLQDDEYSPSSETLGHSGESVVAFIHSHPGTANNMKAEVSSMGWWPNKPALGRVTITGDSYLKSYESLQNAYYYTYFPKSRRLWSVNKAKAPSFIRNISSDYKRFFFGTINTK